MKRVKVIFPLIVITIFALICFLLPNSIFACEDEPDSLVEVEIEAEVETDAECEWTVTKTIEEVPESEEENDNCEENGGEEEVIIEDPVGAICENPDVSLELEEGESKDLQTTIIVDKECPEGEEVNYDFSGTVTVENNHEIPDDFPEPIWVTGVIVFIDGELTANPGIWEEIAEVNVYDNNCGDLILPYCEEEYDFSHSIMLPYGMYNNFAFTAEVDSYEYDLSGWKLNKDLHTNESEKEVVEAPEAANQEATLVDEEIIYHKNGGITVEETVAESISPDLEYEVDDPDLGSTTKIRAWETLTDDTIITYTEKVTGNKDGQYGIYNTAIILERIDLPESPPDASGEPSEEYQPWIFDWDVATVCIKVETPEPKTEPEPKTGASIKNIRTCCRGSPCWDNSLTIYWYVSFIPNSWRKPHFNR